MVIYCLDISNSQCFFTYLRIQKHNNFILIYIMEDEGNELEQRLNKMKALNFAEGRQLQLMRKIFKVLKVNQKERQNKYKEYYNMILYLKSFKGIMEYALMQRQLQSIKKAEEQILQSAKIIQQEDENVKRLTMYIETNRKKEYFANFCKRTKQLIAKRIEQQKQKEHQRQILMQKKKERQIYHKTSQKFHSNQFKQKQIQFTPAQNHYRNVRDSQGASLLLNSRKYAQTQREDNQIRRKYAAIKALPPKPTINMESIIPQIKLDQLPPSQQKTQHPLTQKQAYIPENKIVSLQPKQMEPTLKQPNLIQKQQSSKSIVRTNNNVILALLSEIKMTEILVLNEIIQQKDKVFKNQTNLSEKQYIKSSLKILQRIALLN